MKPIRKSLLRNRKRNLNVNTRIARNDIEGGIMTDQREALLADIARELPPIVFRNWKRWRDIIPMAPRTVANEDSLGKGPKEFVYVGRVKGYPKEAFIDYLRARMRFTESKEAVQLSPRLNVTVRRSGLRSRKIFTQRQRRSGEQQVIL